jgi:preprotein translocase subunit SecD
MVVVAIGALALFAAIAVSLVRELRSAATWEVTAEAPLSAEDGDAVARVLERRIASLVRFGAPASIRRDGSAGFLVDVRGTKASQADLTRVLTHAGILELIPVERLRAAGEPALGPDEFALPDPALAGTMLVLSRAAVLGPISIKEARAIVSSEGKPSLVLAFDGRNALELRELTRRNVGRPVAIVLDGGVLSAPIVREELPPMVQLTFGPATPLDEVFHTAAILSGGPFPETVRLTARRLGPPAE